MPIIKNAQQQTDKKRVRILHANHIITTPRII